MLGRLEMDVDECIMNYIKLMENIFDERSKRLPFGWKGQVKPQFNSTRLESAIKKVITTSGAAEADLFNDGNVRGCKVYAFARLETPSAYQISVSCAQRQKKPKELRAFEATVFLVK